MLRLSTFSDPKSVSILQYRFMVEFVSRDDVGESPYADFNFVGNSSSLPGCWLQVSKKRNCRAAHLLELAC